MWENSGAKGVSRRQPFSFATRTSMTNGTGHGIGAPDLKHFAAREARTRIDNWREANKAEQQLR
jgi:hypothetical protein